MSQLSGPDGHFVCEISQMRRPGGQLLCDISQVSGHDCEFVCGISQLSGPPPLHECSSFFLTFDFEISVVCLAEHACVTFL